MTGSKDKDVETSPAIEWLRTRGVKFAIHKFDYVEGGGTARSSSLLGVPEHSVIKTLVFEDQDRQPLIVLMHGDRNVDARSLALQLGLTKIWSCAPAVAEEFSGWQVGATNPFALKNKIPIHLEESVLQLPVMYINGGGRGLLVSLNPDDFYRSLKPRLVRCAKEKAVLGSKAP